MAYIILIRIMLFKVMLNLRAVKFPRLPEKFTHNLVLCELGYSALRAFYG